MSRILFGFIVLVGCLPACAQGVKYDSAALFIMDRMSDVIGDLSSVHYVAHTSTDDKDHELGLVRHFGVEDVYMDGADKMLVTIKNRKGHRQYMYNGVQLAYYSFTENNYGVIDAPATTIETIDKIHDDYGISVPGADFFYPTFTDDMIALFDEIRYLGAVTVDDHECFQILCKNKNMTVQFWINNDAYTLPAKMLIVNPSAEQPYYEATYSNWAINTDLPASMFDFLPPMNASRLRLVAKNEQ